MSFNSSAPFLASYASFFASSLTSFIPFTNPIRFSVSTFCVSSNESIFTAMISPLVSSFATLFPIAAISFVNCSTLRCKFDTVSASVAIVVSSSIDIAVLVDRPPSPRGAVVIFLGGNNLLDQESVVPNGVAVNSLNRFSCSDNA